MRPCSVEAISRSIMCCRITDEHKWHATMCDTMVYSSKERDGGGKAMLKTTEKPREHNISAWTLAHCYLFEAAPVTKYFFPCTYTDFNLYYQGTKHAYLHLSSSAACRRRKAGTCRTSQTRNTSITPLLKR